MCPSYERQLFVRASPVIMFLSLRALVLVLSSLALCHAAALDWPSLERRDARPTRTQTNAAAAATILTPEEACVRYRLPEVTKLLDEVRRVSLPNAAPGSPQAVPSFVADGNPRQPGGQGSLRRHRAGHS